MIHDATKVLLGTTKSNVREVENRKGSVDAGKVCFLKSDDTYTTVAADGALKGVSLGRDLSGTNKNACCVKGLGVPLRLTAAFNPTVGAVVQVSTTTGLAVSSGTATNAVYASARIDGGIDEDGVTGIGVAFIDFPGGL